jgi:hypothetical protein
MSEVIKCRVDGLRVLKGGLSYATVYFDTKEATRAALDLNGEEAELLRPGLSATPIGAVITPLEMFCEGDAMVEEGMRLMRESCKEAMSERQAEPIPDTAPMLLPEDGEEAENGE